MKKVLLGTTALVAAGAFAGIGAAQAQDMMEPVSVGVGGYYTLAGGSFDQDGIDNRGHGIQQNIEIEVGGDTTLDNGITAGVRIRISGNNPNDDFNNVDETEVFFTGSFGALHLGMIEPAAQQMTVWAPGGAAWGGIKSPYFGGLPTGMWTTANMGEDSTKVVYFSPSFNGISLGVSYAPEDSTDSYAGLDDNESAGMDLKHGEQLTAAVSYSGDAMGGSFSANVGYETNSTESMEDGTACDGMTMNCDPKGMRYGLSVSIDQISLGAAIYEYDDTGANMETTHTDAGIGWSEGPLSLGVQHGINDMGKTENNITTLNVSYNLGSGIDIGAQYGTGEKWNADADDGKGGMGVSQDFTQILLGTHIAF